MNVEDLISILQTHHPKLEVWITMNEEYASPLTSDGVGVGDPTPSWRRSDPTYKPGPDRLVLSN